MALKPSIRDREFDKFCGNPSGLTSVRVCGDPTAEPILVDIADEFDNGEALNIYGSASSVAASTLTTIVTYTVPAGKVLLLKEFEASGCNISEFTVFKDAAVIAFKRSYWCDFNVSFLFHGYKLIAGEVAILKAEHARPSVGNFEARIVGVLKDA